MPAIPFGPGAWHKALICLLLAAIGPAIPAFSAAGTGLLTLAEVQQLALLEQPALVAGEANVHALRDEAVVAGQLPDPQLIAGINQLPVNEGEAFSLRDDDFTALSVGISQEFPRAAKRQLRAIALEQQAKAAEVGLTAVERRVKLRAALAYLDVASAAQAAVLLDRLGAEAETQLAVRGIAVVSGQGSQSEQLAAGVEAEVLADRGRALRQRELAGRAELARWIGPISADRPIPEGVPALPDPPPLSELLAQLPQHPQLAAPEVAVRIATTQAQLAGLGTRPDWRVELRYDHRLEFPDLVTLMVGVDLPLLPGNRQDRSSSAARARLTAGEAELDDHLREATATLTRAYRQWQAGTDRLRRYEDSLLPQSHAQVQSALAAYRSAKTPLTAVLDARRGLLDVELMRLDLAVDVARDRLQIQYFEAEDGQ